MIESEQKISLSRAQRCILIISHLVIKHQFMHVCVPELNIRDPWQGLEHMHMGFKPVQAARYPSLMWYGTLAVSPCLDQLWLALAQIPYI